MVDPEVEWAPDQADFRSAAEVAADARADGDRAAHEAAADLYGLGPLDALLRSLLDGGLQVAPPGYPRAAAYRIEPDIGMRFTPAT